MPTLIRRRYSPPIAAALLPSNATTSDPGLLSAPDTTESDVERSLRNANPIRRSVTVPEPAPTGGIIRRNRPPRSASKSEAGIAREFINVNDPRLRSKVVVIGSDEPGGDDLGAMAVDRDFTKSHNTDLESADLESQFQDWVRDQSARRKRDVLMDLKDYDLRGHWNEIGWANPKDEGHYHDRYKKPNHPTFSTESIYHNTPNPDWRDDKKVWQGGTWAKNDEGKWVFTAGPDQAVDDFDRKKLKRYFKENEPDAVLVIPNEPADQDQMDELQ